MSTLAQSRLTALSAHPATPLITDCTQGRVELSHATFDNWVSKTVNFLQLEAGLGESDVVRLDLPLHWMTAVWLVATWEAGADISFGGAADLHVSVHSGADVVVVPDPLGMAPAPSGLSAQWFFPADVRAMPDQRVLASAPPGSLAGMTAAELFTAAKGYAERIGLQPGGRVQSTQAPTDLDSVLAGIGAALALDAAVIYGESPQEQPTAFAH